MENIFIMILLGFIAFVSSTAGTSFIMIGNNNKKIIPIIVGAIYLLVVVANIYCIYEVDRLKITTNRLQHMYSMTIGLILGTLFALILKNKLK